jgi:shikimate kinase
MPPVLLVGFMASGKTSVASLLADLLGWPWVDLDREIERAEARSIPEIFEADGEAAFRRAEAVQLDRWLGAGNAVIATGGGLFAVARNRTKIRDAGARTVFLDLPWAVLERRISAGDPRSRPKYRAPDAARELLEERLPSYRSADVTVALSGSESPAEVARLVHREIERVACGT